MWLKHIEWDDTSFTLNGIKVLFLLTEDDITESPPADDLTLQLWPSPSTDPNLPSTFENSSAKKWGIGDIKFVKNADDALKMITSGQV